MGKLPWQPNNFGSTPLRQLKNMQTCRAGRDSKEGVQITEPGDPHMSCGSWFHAWHYGLRVTDTRTESLDAPAARGGEPVGGTKALHEVTNLLRTYCARLGKTQTDVAGGRLIRRCLRMGEVLG